MDEKSAKKTLQKQYKRQNNYIKENFDRVTVTLPKGTKNRILNTGESLNGFVNSAVSALLAEYENEKDL